MKSLTDSKQSKGYAWTRRSSCASYIVPDAVTTASKRAMLARRQLCIFALAALVACAVARPELNVATKPSNANRNSNTTPEVVTPNKESRSLQTESNSVVSSAENNVVPVGSPNAESQPTQLFQDVSKPVNKRFPHAVLFGGTCGGSIISPKWVLAAGHCTLFTGGRYVLAGTNNTDDGSGVRRRVKKLHIHPLFSVGPYWLDAHRYNIKQVAARWDYLLAELADPLELDGENIAKIELDDQLESVPDTLVGYAGYGTDHHGGTMRSEMHAMDLKIQSNEVCGQLEQYNSEDMLCARGYAPRYDAACNGDSGSGLVGNGRLMGIASWVQNDAVECKNGNLVVFSRVARARDWIRQVSGV